MVPESTESINPYPNNNSAKASPYFAKPSLSGASGDRQHPALMPSALILSQS
jgi:hypothetical protein